MIYSGYKNINKVYLGGELVYSDGNTVTYYVDSGVINTEKIAYGESVLTPSSFTPMKEGYTFLGWRLDNNASSTVYSNLLMGDDPITLYAVFKQDITITYYNNSTTASATKLTRYYNNGNTANPSFSVSQAAKSGWTARGWAASTTGNASVLSSLVFSANTTIYGCYQRTVTITYNGNSSTSGSTAASTGTAYYNSAGNTTNASITLRANGFTRTSYTFAGWRTGTSSGTVYKAGASYSSASDITLYAYWITTTTDFAYTGGVQTYTVPVTGTYKLSVWGAKGGNGFGRVGGNGGYSYGNASLTAGTVLYVVVGGAGLNFAYGNYSQNWNLRAGGYNGGGNTAIHYDADGDDTTNRAGSGGGATHIAKRTGLLSALSSYKSDILIVAGGGGGGFGGPGAYSGQGGTGGGTTGGDGSVWFEGDEEPGGIYCGKGGTQTSSPNGNQNASRGGFGYGGSCLTSGDQDRGIAGGGGGYYGGGAGSYYGGAGGGSGYIGGVTGGATSNGVQSGNGKAQITLVSVS